MLRVGFFQFHPRFGEISRNCDTVIAALAGVEADLMVLPELPFSGYYFQSREEAMDLAEDPADSQTVKRLVDLCRERDRHLVTGFTERAGKHCYNSALLIGPGGIEHTYRKLHLFNEEKHWFDPGDTPLSVQTVRGVKVGLMICFDWVFPEVARTLAVLGAEVICHPSNLVLSYCQDAMLTRCLENGVFAVTANRFGADVRPRGELTFTGQSQIAAPKGKQLHRARPDEQACVVVEIDPAAARDKHMTALNDVMADRRPAFYAPLAAE